VVCLIDPVGDVYACPFAIHENFLAGNVRSPGGFEQVWRASQLFAELRQPQTGGACHYNACQGGCMAAKFSPGCRWTGRTRSACAASASKPSPLATRTPRSRNPR
jgi:radical SAM protein with 4Fe4S-binding SPASM domain